jgi:hypothetical protein
MAVAGTWPVLDDDARRRWLERLSQALSALAAELRRDDPSHHRALIKEMDTVRERLERELYEHEGEPPA